jgi:hypothetical protein
VNSDFGGVFYGLVVLLKLVGYIGEQSQVTNTLSLVLDLQSLKSGVSTGNAGFRLGIFALVVEVSRFLGKRINYTGVGHPSNPTPPPASVNPIVYLKEVE